MQILWRWDLDERKYKVGSGMEMGESKDFGGGMEMNENINFSGEMEMRKKNFFAVGYEEKRR